MQTATQIIDIVKIESYIIFFDKQLSILIKVLFKGVG